MANTNYQNVGYSLSQGPLTSLSTLPTVAKRVPNAADKNFQIGQLWIVTTTNDAYILTSVVSNSAQWQLLGGASGAGAFTTVTAATTIAAGTTVTAGTGVTATTGNITATNGNFVLSTAASFLSLPGPVFFRSGAGAPAGALALHVGDLYINTTAATAATRLYIATAIGVWTNLTAAA